MIGALVVFCVGVLFRTPARVLESAARHAEEAQTAEDAFRSTLRESRRQQTSLRPV